MNETEMPAAGPDQRRSPRYRLRDISAEIDGRACEIADVSPTGILLKEAGGGRERGDAVTVTLSVPLMERIVPVRVDGFVVRADERGTAIDYVRPAVTWPQVLKVLDYRQGRAKA